MQFHMRVWAAASLQIFFCENAAVIPELIENQHDFNDSN